MENINLLMQWAQKTQKSHTKTHNSQTAESQKQREISKRL